MPRSRSIDAGWPTRYSAAPPIATNSGNVQQQLPPPRSTTAVAAVGTAAAADTPAAGSGVSACCGWSLPAGLFCLPAAILAAVASSAPSGMAGGSVLSFGGRPAAAAPATGAAAGVAGGRLGLAQGLGWPSSEELLPPATAAAACVVTGGSFVRRRAPSSFGNVREED